MKSRDEVEYAHFTLWKPALAHRTQSHSSVNHSSAVEAAFLHAWYGKKRWVWWLLPIALVYWGITLLRRYYLTSFCQTSMSVPVVVVGNITLGGTGKTPFLITLIKKLQAAGFNPGVITRGYGGNPPTSTYILDESSTAAMSGDEPLSIYERTGAMVCVDRDRVAAGRALIARGCDILLSDDGLQQYRLARDIEIVLIDGQRGLGNGMCLPVGPLREMPTRLKKADLIVLNSPNSNYLDEFSSHSPYVMAMQPNRFVKINTRETLSLDYFRGHDVIAVAGIGNPLRFKNTLDSLEIKSQLRAFSDHHDFQAADFLGTDNIPVIMTEKDAVKCKSFAQDNWFYLEVSGVLEEKFWRVFEKKLNSIISVVPDEQSIFKK